MRFKDDPFHLTDENIKEVQEHLEKIHGREFTRDEAWDEAAQLNLLVKNVFKHVQEELRRLNILKEQPDGFAFDKDGYGCHLCGHSAPVGHSWFDRWGLKCMDCQKGINDRTIPGYVVKYQDSWYSGVDLFSYFNLDRKECKSLIKAGVLKKRVILNSHGKLHMEFFLMADHKGVLPSKKLLKDRLVWEVGKDGNHTTTMPWFEFTDAALIKKLSKYKIFPIMKKAFTKPVIRRVGLVSRGHGLLCTFQDGEPTACLYTPPSLSREKVVVNQNSSPPNFPQAPSFEEW